MAARVATRVGKERMVVEVARLRARARELHV